MPKLTLFDFLSIVDRVRILDHQHRLLTGRYANVVYLPPDEFVDVILRHEVHGEDVAFRPANPPAMVEATLLGLFIRIDTYAKAVRVAFKES